MKRLISFVLTLTLIFSVFAVSAVNASAATLNDTKLYYQYVKNNYTLTNLEGFYKNHSFVNNSVFSIVTKDFNGDGVREMILFFVKGASKDEMSVYARLYRIQNGSVTACNTTDEIDVIPVGNGCCSVCAESYDRGFKLYFESCSFGGSSFSNDWMIFAVENNKLILKKDYSQFSFPRYGTDEIKEDVSGKTYSSDSAFNADCKRDGLVPFSHSHNDMYEPSYSYSTIQSKSRLKGNHIFTILTDVNFNTDKSYFGFINDNTNLQYKINHLSCPYPDVPTNSWYYEGVKYCYQKNFILGFDNGNFGPTQNIRRQDFVCILARIAGANLSSYQSQTPKFKDVPKGSYYAAAVNWAVANKIVSGYNSTRFGVGDAITREQVATILYNYKKSPSVSNADGTLARFSDRGRISSYAKTPLAWAVNNGVISGMSDGRIAAKEGASRAQIAAMVMNMDKKGLFK